MKKYGTLYLDKEKDIVIEFYKERNSYYYLLKTPNHHSGNLITNLAKAFNLELSFNEDGLKVIRGKVPSFINEDNERIHILKFKNKTVAVINEEGEIKPRASITAIAKTLMSQTKSINLPLDKILVRTYLEEEYKFKTDVHTHMNANLHPDILIALGIYHQIAYPYYYVLKLDLRLNAKQKEKLLRQRDKVAKSFNKTNLSGKHKERRINDNTFINFADLILKNLENADYNIEKIRASLCILKDGQAVFTNLEKLYLYRYVFTKGTISNNKIKLQNTNKINDENIRNALNIMIKDHNGLYKNNSLLEDKLLWIARSYQKQGVKYIEISNTSLVKKEEGIDLLETCHKILPIIEKETGVKIRFLAALRRIPLTIIKDRTTPENYLRDNLNVLKALAYDPYVMGCDFVGEEINDIRELEPVIKELVDYCRINPYFAIRIHAGENDALTNNVYYSILCVKEALNKKQKMPVLRIGHGLYTPSLKTKKGKELIKLIKDNNVFLEFQITSNVRLNNLSSLDKYPLKEYLNCGVKCLQGTDGCGIYGTNTFDEELALINLLDLSRRDLNKMIKAEKEAIEISDKYFKHKYQRLKNKNLREFFNKEIQKNEENARLLRLNITNKYLSFDVLNKQIVDLPLDKMPVVLAGGSFNSDTRKEKLLDFEKRIIDRLLNELNPKKCFFVVGHKLRGYEKYLFDHNKDFDIFAIVPADISKSEKDKLIKAKINVRISTESLGMGIYKSFNYEIFERRPSILIAMEGNSAGVNLIQEAKNGKAKALIYVSNNDKRLSLKAESLKGYVNVYANDSDVNLMIKEIKKSIKTNK